MFVGWFLERVIVDTFEKLIRGARNWFEAELIEIVRCVGRRARHLEQGHPAPQHEIYIRAGLYHKNQQLYKSLFTFCA